MSVAPLEKVVGSGGGGGKKTKLSIGGYHQQIPSLFMEQASFYDVTELARRHLIKLGNQALSDGQSNARVCS